MVWINPKTDWITNPIKPRSQDFNRIEGNIAFLKDEIENKKGVIVKAINKKQQLVTVENSYAELADAINQIHKNPRFATGTASFTLINPEESSAYGAVSPRARQMKMTVSGLPFKPAKVFVLGQFRARLNSDSTFSTGTWEVWIDYPFAIVDGVIRPSQEHGLYSVEGGGNYMSTASVSLDVSYSSDGFTVTITSINNATSRRMLALAANNTQTWYAYEQEG